MILKYIKRRKVKVREKYKKTSRVKNVGKFNFIISLIFIRFVYHLLLFSSHLNTRPIVQTYPWIIKHLHNFVVFAQYYTILIEA
jgi:hypothetical protein